MSSRLGEIRVGLAETSPRVAGLGRLPDGLIVGEDDSSWVELFYERHPRWYRRKCLTLIPQDLLGEMRAGELRCEVGSLASDQQCSVFTRGQQGLMSNTVAGCCK